jgi:small-conductance mechanosensitive channel
LQDLLARTGSSPLVLVIVAIAIGAIAHLALRIWARRRARQEAARAESDAAPGRGWLARGLVWIVPPLGFLIWIQALYVVLELLVAQAGDRPLVAPARVALRWAYGLSMLGGAVWLLARIGRAVEGFLTSLAQRADTAWDDVLLPLAGRAIRGALPLLAVILAAPLFAISPELVGVVRSATSLMLIALIAYVLYQVVDAVATFVLTRHRLDVSDNLRARAIYTQVTVLKKVAVTTIAIFTLASMLMVFDSVRQLGASILASAGIAGIVVGFAAQKSIATVLAGFQIALTQPIRVDDVVIVSGEWGRIEEITLTYVIVQVWDQRRLVVPITYFLEEPFQNWTRASAEILGTVFLHLDYTMPIEPLREEVGRLLSASPLWDGRVQGVQVTEARDRTLEVRVLASAADASRAWDLRCELREKLIAFVRERHPECLPRVRLAGPGAAESNPSVSSAV